MSIQSEVEKAEQFYYSLINDETSYTVDENAPFFPAHSVWILNHILKKSMHSGRAIFGKPIFALYFRNSKKELHNASGPAVVEWLLNCNSFDPYGSDNKISIITRHECYNNGVLSNIDRHHDAITVRNMNLKYDPEKEFPYSWHSGSLIYKESRKNGMLHNQHGSSIIYKGMNASDCPNFWNHGDILCNETCASKHVMDHLIRAYHVNGMEDGMWLDYPSRICSIVLETDILKRMGLNPKLAEREIRLCMVKIYSGGKGLHEIKFSLHETFPDEKIVLVIPKIITPFNVFPEEFAKSISQSVINGMLRDYSDAYENFMKQLKKKIIKVVGSEAIFPPEKDFSALEI